MAHENAQSESLKQLVEQLDAKPPVVLLPEFQRDFVWEMEQTYALFDSLIRGIFVGSVIYGKPSFEMTLRSIDKTPRRGKGSRAKPERRHYTQAEITSASQTRGLKILLDGQQRTTSLYRTLKGYDKVYFMVTSTALDVEIEEIKRLSLEALLHPDDDERGNGIRGTDSPEDICVPLDYAFQFMTDVPEDEDVREFFDTKTAYGVALAAAGEAEKAKKAFRIFRQVLSKLKTMFEQPQLLSYYLLDMELDKFTTFFERSNSKGIQLNFTDILAAKVFGNFNLRMKFEEFADQHPGIPVNRELMVRGIALMTGEFEKIEKAELLKRLKAEHFNVHWAEMTDLLVRSLQYLHSQRLLVAVKWLPYDNMLLPLMLFFRELKLQGQSTPSQQQWDFLRWWYWSSVFTERYTGASNEKIVQDTKTLQRIARGEELDSKVFARMRPSLDVSDLFSYTRYQAAVYRGVFNLVHFKAVSEAKDQSGLKDWRSNALLDTGPLGARDLHDHHFFPRAFLRKSVKEQADPDIESYMDSILNRVLMPKDANFSASDKKPYTYLQEFLAKNPKLPESMASHLVPVGLLEDEGQSFRAHELLQKRGEKILGFIQEETSDIEPEIRSRFLAAAPGYTAE